MFDDIFNIFQDEAAEHLRCLEEGLLDLEQSAHDDSSRPLIDSLFRHAHSLKGDARALGLETLEAVARILEDQLDPFRRDPDGISRESIAAALRAVDAVKQAFADWRAELAGPEGASNVGLARAVAAEPAPASQQPGGLPNAAEATEEPESRPTGAPATEATVRVPAEKLDRMLSTAGEIRIVRRSREESLEIVRHLRQQLLGIRQTIRDQIPDARTTIEGVLDHFRRLERELRKADLREQLLIESLESDIREARLLPLSLLADTFRRVVRDLAESLGKQVRYRTDVAAVLLDRSVLDALREPLMHLLRNAVDHAIESPEERAAAGKPAEGTITLAASLHGDYATLTLSDDGRGLDFQRIRRRLLESGAMTASDLESATDEDLINQIFEPGFTTAPTGTVSGRGVGLDVVRAVLRRLHGDVEIASTSAAGTTLRLRVPVSISTGRIVTVRAGGHLFGIPSSHVVRTGRVATDRLERFEAGWLLPGSSEAVPVLHLTQLLQLEDLRPAQLSSVLEYLLVAAEDRRVALAVDELVEEGDVVIKPLGYPLTDCPGVLGGAIQADGTAKLILDVAHLARQKPAAITTQTPAAPRGRILVVDDSPTTRTILKNLFHSAGYHVRTAIDGIDALEQMRRHPVDVVVTDFEMPRLNGIDLTRRVKAEYGLPVILVTAREQESDRRQGLEVGADAYVVKSTFDDTSLVSIVRDFVDT